MSLINFLQDSIEKICPIIGVSIGKLEDKKTWRFDAKPEATEDQRAAAQAIIDNGAELLLNYRRQVCLNRLLAKRDEVIQSGVMVDGNAYFTDAATVALILEAITMQGLGIGQIFPRKWILADGNIIDMTFELIKIVAVAIAAKKNACYENYIALAQNIRESSDPESVDISQGWPE